MRPSRSQNATLAPTQVAHVPASEAQARAMALLESLGVAHRKDALPRELSGGEAQRVAIARAMAMQPPLLLLIHTWKAQWAARDARTE